MSLQLAANHLSAQGRGPDSTLVHMSPGEVKSLQQIAMAHGGSLSINPETGLPEAGFLKSILPMIAGAGLSMIPGVGPLMAAALVGGGTTIATGSLEKGLMSGLGAYGGAGLAGGLMGAGTAAAQQGAAAGLGQGASQAAMNEAAAQATKNALANPLSTMGQGLTGLTETGGRNAFMSSVGDTKGLLTSGLAAAAPMMMAGNSSQPPGIKPTTPTTPLQYNANPIGPTPAPDSPGYGNQGQDSGRQRRYFNHQFTPINQPAPSPLAPITTMPIMNDYGGGMAAGGPVEEMSLSNAYAMQNARGGVSDMGIDAFTGMQRMAGGGITGNGELNLNIPLNLGGGGGFNQGVANGYQPAGSGALSSPPGFLAPKLNSTVGLTENSGQNMTGGGMLAGMGGTAANGFMSPAGGGFGLGGDLQRLAGATRQIGGMGSGRPEDNMGSAPLAHVLRPGTAAYDDYAKNRGPSNQFERFAAGGMAGGGISHLGDYSDGGRLLKGPGDGVSDDIPAMIGEKQPARLADGEFVIPARIVSELGNGSTEAGARKLYAMMDRIQDNRRKTIGDDNVAVDSKSDRYLPA